MTATQFAPAPMPETDAKKRAVDRVAEAAHRLNDAVQRAIAAGYSVELVRTSRHHDGAGNWGDQIVPTVRANDRSASAKS